MKNRNITVKRIEQFIERLGRSYYRDLRRLSCEYVTDGEPIPYDSLDERTFTPINPGDVWGGQWDSAWFRFSGRIPETWEGSEVVALIDTGSEACVFRGGSPWMGLTNTTAEHSEHRRRRVPLGTPGGEHRRRRVPPGTAGGEHIELLVEAAANNMFGARSMSPEYRLRQADIALFDRELWQIVLDLEFLFDLAQGLEHESTRSRRIIAGLNEAANVWAEGAGRKQVCEIAADLLGKPANASSPTVWSVGHGHLDLGWLWPIRETRRKGGRTFSTQLRLLDEYPDYIFGASQPQLFEWMKNDYPSLYEEIREAVASGRIEPQGAMWVEPDMNLTSGESLVRQCLYGKRFFREEFGVDVRHLWLPDVFGYSAALPQILLDCGVDVFMTQKISWNEMNTFPHHTFLWEGIDGSRVRSHFLPTNTYNHDNRPGELVAGEKRFAEGDRFAEFMNLYGVGDGGGGPSRLHIERGRRARDTEGAPRVRFASAETFFDRLRAVPEQHLPLWKGELYLELHRGTYTTQARIKRYNRRLEHLLHDVELLAVLAGYSRGMGSGPTAELFERLDDIWKETLLNQFHDILPGSSIAWVYRDAHEASERNMSSLIRMRDALLSEIFQVDVSTRRDSAGAESSPSAARVQEARPDAPSLVGGRDGLILFNPLAWEREAVVSIASSDADAASSGSDADAAVDRRRIRVPATGFARVAAQAGDQPQAGSPVYAGVDRLENELVRVALADDGSITSIYRKDLNREYLDGGANVFTLWEDYPYSWDAWDISHYYRETTPERARLVHASVESAGGLLGGVRLAFEIGNSTIVELLSLEAGSAVLRADCRVEWREKHKHLRVGAETSLHAASARYEIQYGMVERPTHSNTSWDEARFEVAAHRFADLSRPDAGFAVLNDCKYGHRIEETEVELTLLRSPDTPDPEADIGEHAFAFAYLGHGGLDDMPVVLRAAHELNAPLLAVPTDGIGALPGSGGRGESEKRGERAARLAPRENGAHFAVEGEAVKLELVKPAEDGGGVIVRLYETLGSQTSVTVRVPQAYTKATPVNLLEEERSGSGNGTTRHGLDAAELAEGRFPAAFEPFEIRTFRLE